MSRRREVRLGSTELTGDEFGDRQLVTEYEADLNAELGRRQIAERRLAAAQNRLANAKRAIG